MIGGRCPECGKQLHWFGDSDTWEEEVYVSIWVCNPCHIEVHKYFGEGLEEQEECKGE